MVKWTYRVAHYINIVGEDVFTIRRTNYDKNGEPETDHLPVHPEGSTLADLRTDLERMLHATHTKILEKEEKTDGV